MKLFIISDEHYYHSRIIEYEDRPFTGIYLYKYMFYNPVIEMNETIINNYNTLVSNSDIVIHLGDFCFGGVDLVQPIANRLNGQKILIMGNHDRKRTPTWFHRMGFIKVFKKPIHLDNIILSHKPIVPEILKQTNKINFHGHIHNNIHYNEFLENSSIPEKYVNFAVEFTDYKPFEITNKAMKREILKAVLDN